MLYRIQQKGSKSKQDIDMNEDEEEVEDKQKKKRHRELFQSDKNQFHDDYYGEEDEYDDEEESDYGHDVYHESVFNNQNAFGQ